jgi:hypothetical protein
MPRFSVRSAVIGTAAMGAWAAVAFAQGPPPPPACPDGEDQVTTSTQGYGKPSQTMVLRMETISDGITNATVTVTGEDGSSTTIPAELDPYGDPTKIFAVAPASGASFTVTFAWDQGVGTAACHGTNAYTLPLVPLDAAVGKPTANRLEGKWRMRYRPIGYAGKRERTTWTLKPKCDYFGCDTRMHSTGHLDGVVKLRSDGSYRFEVTDHAVGSCTVTNTTVSTITGQVLSRRTIKIRHAFRPRTRINLRVKTASNGEALTVTGLYWLRGSPTPRAANAGCRGYNQYEHVDGRRLSG